jgi:hypothetical protein
MKIKQQRPQLDYLLQETRRQLIDFSNMADTKANILLSVSSVLITLSLSRINDKAFTTSVLVLTVFMFITITLALMTVSPSIDVSMSKKKSPDEEDFNLLFFGNYSHMSYDMYARHMEKILNDPDEAYEVQVHEIYHAGLYLKRTKYNYIKYGYMFFFIGMISSVTIFLIQNFL